jgi:hypothetical protein
MHDDNYMCSLPMTKGTYKELSKDGISIKTFERIKKWCRSNAEHHMKAEDGLAKEYHIGKAHAYVIVADMIELIESEPISLNSKPKFTAVEVQDILVEYGQHMGNFRFMETIRYTPSDVGKILNLKCLKADSQQNSI